MGYTARPDASLDNEVTASDKITDLPASFTWEQWPGLRASTHDRAPRYRASPFQTQSDWQAQRLTIAVILDQNGAVIMASAATSS